MSVTHSVHCDDCDADAPDVGDMGSIGFPSLSMDPRKKADVPQNFGYIYQGFLGVGLLTQELDEFLAFLCDHVGHRLMILEEDDAPYEDHEDDAWYRKARDAANGPPRPAQGLEYHVAKFEAACGRCDEKITSEHVDTVRRGGPHTVSSTAIDEYHDRVIKRLDNDFYRSEPFNSADLEQLGTFLRRHKAHDPTVAFIPQA